jgi:hypothetical protein
MPADIPADIPAETPAEAPADIQADPAPAPVEPAPADPQPEIVEANWTHTALPADHLQEWALHGAPLSPAPSDPAVPVVPPAAVPAAPADPNAPAPDPAIAIASAAADALGPDQVANGVQHLSSPDNLPPGTSTEPVGPQSGPNVSYLRELWHAVQTQQISGSDALVALAQRPMTTPVNGSTAPGASEPGQAAPVETVAAEAPAPVDPALVPGS